MDAEEPFTSEFSRWIHGGINVAGARPRRNNEAAAAQYNSCGESTKSAALEGRPGPKPTMSKNRMSCQQSPFPVKYAANATHTPLANSTYRNSIDSARRQAMNEHGSPVRHWQ